MIKKCEVCGKKFKANTTGRPKKLCSAACSRKKYKINNKTYHSKYCGMCEEEIIIPDNKRTHHAYCNECYKDYQRVYRQNRVHIRNERKEYKSWRNDFKKFIYRVENNNREVTLVDINDIITYFQLIYLIPGVSEKSSMGEEIKDMYDKIYKYYIGEEKLRKR